MLEFWKTYVLKFTQTCNFNSADDWNFTVFDSPKLIFDYMLLIFNR